MIWLLEFMKVINLIYRGGAGGEFFGGLLTELPEVANKQLQHNPDTERWFLQREDYQSHEPEVTRNDPREVQKPEWHKDLWNVRLDHGYGFPINQEFWTDYCWNDWEETKTIVFLSKTKESLDYTQTLAKCKLVRKEDHQAGEDMIRDGILEPDQFWNRPWESQADMFAMWMDTIPSDHSVLLVDPCELLFNNKEETKQELKRVVDYLDVVCPSNWQNKIEGYRVKNKSLINNTII